MKNDKYIWYASYGSNLSRDRFLCYIKGGKPVGSEIIEVGCRDKSLPIKEATFTINYPLYFAKDSIRWQNQGVAFIGLKKDNNYEIHSSKYLITTEQFIEVVKQENNGVELEIDFDEVKKDGFQTISDTWYGTILYIGEESGFPIFTFTADWDLDVPYNKPSQQYLSMIIEGLKKTVKLNNTEIIDYLCTKQGVENNYSRSEIEKLL